MALFNLAHFAVRAGNYTGALSHVRSGTAIAQELRMRELLIDGTMLLSAAIAEAEGDALARRR